MRQQRIPRTARRRRTDLIVPALTSPAADTTAAQELLDRIDQILEVL